MYLQNKKSNVEGILRNANNTMIDFNSMHQIVSHRSIPTTRISTFLVSLISFLLFLILITVSVMLITYIRRKFKKRLMTSGLLCRDETSETLIESTLINNDTQTMYSAIDV